MDGGLGGFQAGANYQVGAWVFGVEGQFSWADLHGSHVESARYRRHLTTKVKRISNVAGRLGYAFDRTLIYVRGCGAWVRDDHTKIDAGAIEATGRASRSGWLIGTGIEHAFFGNWSGKVEYNFMDFGRRGVTMVEVGGGAPEVFNVQQEIHSITFGLNWRFGPGL